MIRGVALSFPVNFAGSGTQEDKKIALREERVVLNMEIRTILQLSVSGTLLEKQLPSPLSKEIRDS